MDFFCRVGARCVDENEKTCMGHVECGMLFKHPMKVSAGLKQESGAEKRIQKCQ